jgi:hypothetical protein
MKCGVARLQQSKARTEKLPARCRHPGKVSFRHLRYQILVQQQVAAVIAVG